MPLRSPKMNSFILGFQRFVWWPKCTPASSRSFIAIGSKLPPVLSLALAELEALPGARQPVLLPFLGARVPRQQTVLLEGPPQLRVERHERPRDAEPERAGLAGHAAAVHVGQHIELIGRLGQDQRLADLHPQRFDRKRVVERAAVDGDRAGAWPEKDPCGGGLATAGAVILGNCHGYATLISEGFCAACG